MEVLTTKLPEDQKDRIDELAEKYDASRSAVARDLLLLGQQAWERYPSQFPLEPDSPDNE